MALSGLPAENADQLPRLLKFLADYPRCHVQLDRSIGLWRAEMEFDHGCAIHASYELSDLLNTLENRYAEKEEQ